VAILQGPVAVHHSIKKDEPIKDNVVLGLTAKVSEHYYRGDECKIPTIDYLGVKPAPVPSLPGAHVLGTGDEVRLTPPVPLPSAKHWLQVLAGSELNWWHAIVRSEFVVQGTYYITNPLHRVLVPRAGQKIVIRLLGDQLNQFSIHGAARSFGQHQADFLTVDVHYDVSSCLINMMRYLSTFGSNMSHRIHMRPSARLWKAATSASKSSTGDCGLVMKRSFRISTCATHSPS
jgi:fatty acid synthase subunit alpha, fungi type